MVIRMRVLLYTQAKHFSDHFYVELNYLHKTTPIECLWVIGDSLITGTFIKWAADNGIPTKTKEILWAKYNYDAFNRAVSSIMKEGIDLVVIPVIDTNSLDLSHVARLKGIPVISLSNT